METLTFLLTSTFYPPNYVGGACLQAKYLAEELSKAGHEVHVLYSLDAYRVKKKGAVERDSQDPIHVHTIKTSFNSTAYSAYLLGSSYAVTKKFKSLVKEIKPDVVHHHNISLLGYPLLKKRSDYLNLYTAHDYWLICQHSTLLKNRTDTCKKRDCINCAFSYRLPPQLWRYSSSFKNAVQDIDLIVTPSEFVKTIFSTYFSKKKIICLPNFIPKMKQQKKPTSNFTNYFLYSGRLERYKGILELIDFYKTLPIESNLVITGSGSLSDTVTKKLKDENLGGRITFLGHVRPEILSYLMSNAQALIIPSIWPENCPLIALEALSQGTPVIGTNKGGLPEIIEKIDSNLIYQSPEKLKQILLNFNRGDYVSSKVRETFEKKYSAEVFMKQYSRILAKDNL